MAVIRLIFIKKKLINNNKVEKHNEKSKIMRGLHLNKLHTFLRTSATFFNINATIYLNFMPSYYVDYS